METKAIIELICTISNAIVTPAVILFILMKKPKKRNEYLAKILPEIVKLSKDSLGTVNKKIITEYAKELAYAKAKEDNVTIKNKELNKELKKEL